MPTVALSSNKAHVSVNTGAGSDYSNNVGEMYSRDFNYYSWSSPIAITTNPSFSRVDKIFAKSDYMHAFYYVNADPIVLKYRKKSVNDTSWSSEITVDNAVYPTNQTHKLSISQTYDDSIHVCYIRPPYGLATRSILKYGSTFSQLSSVSEGGVSHRDHAVTTTSNDKFYIYSQVDNYYKYRQYDALPLAPPNLAVSIHTIPSGQFPKLNWTLNNEPDVRINDDGYLIERRTRITNDPWSEWSQIGTASGFSSEFIDYGINTAGSGFNDAEYKIAANDFNNHASPFSSSVQIEYGHMGRGKISLGLKPTEYLLDRTFQILSTQQQKSTIKFH